MHYVWGLVASSFNGGIMGLGALGIMSEQQKLPEGFTAHVLLHTFGVACGIHALLYFKQNPLPEKFPTDTVPPLPTPVP
jgi:hypothetical protein